MHEYSLIQALISRVGEEARRQGGLRVHSLTVRLGELSGVEPELMTTAFAMARPGTPCAEATLRLERVAAVWSCPGCAKVFARGEVLRCAACGLPAALNDGADALTLERMELEEA
jgi:hydrogenase nickel incorporation protein HypA/HybF